MKHYRIYTWAKRLGLSSTRAWRLANYLTE